MAFEACHNCDLRYPGCAKKIPGKGQKCPGFMPGKCFYCAMNDLSDGTLCNYGSWPAGCDDFKPGNDYDEYLAMLNGDDPVLPEGSVHAKNPGKIKNRKRHEKEARHKAKLFNKAKYGGSHPGLYIDKDDGRVKLWGRGEASRWLKKLAHRKVRREPVDSETLYQRGLHKKLFDYWWELL